MGNTTKKRSLSCAFFIIVIPIFYYLPYMIKHTLLLTLICIAFITSAQNIDATILNGKWQISRLREGNVEFTADEIQQNTYVVIDKKLKQDKTYVPTKQDSSAARMTHFSLKQRVTISFISTDGKGNVSAVLGMQGQSWDGVVPFAGTYTYTGTQLAANLKKSGAMLNISLTYSNGELLYNDANGNLIMAFRKQ